MSWCPQNDPNSTEDKTEFETQKNLLNLKVIKAKEKEEE